MGFDDRALSDFASLRFDGEVWAVPEGRDRLLRGTVARSDRARRGGADRRDLPVESDHAAHDARVEGRALRAGRRRSRAGGFRVPADPRDGGGDGGRPRQRHGRVRRHVERRGGTPVRPAGGGHHGACVRRGVRDRTRGIHGVRRRIIRSARRSWWTRTTRSTASPRRSRSIAELGLTRTHRCAPGQRRHRRAVASRRATCSTTPGLPQARVFASGGLDEHEVGALVTGGRAGRRVRHRHADGRVGRRARGRFGLQADRVRRAAHLEALRRARSPRPAANRCGAGFADEERTAMR